MRMIIFSISIPVFLFFAITSLSAAWQEPTCAPPGCNRPQPITREGGNIISGNLNLSQDVGLLTPSITFKNNYISLQGSSNKIYVQSGDTGSYGYGIYSIAQSINTVAGTDNTVGIWGQASTDNNQGSSYGVMGTASGTQRIAVYGYAADDGYAVYGQSVGDTSGYAGYFLGNTKVNLRRPITGNNDTFIVKSYWENINLNNNVINVTKSVAEGVDDVLITGSLKVGGDDRGTQQLCLNDKCITDLPESNQVFTSVSTPTGTWPVADDSFDTLTLLAGGNVTIEGNENSDSVSFNTNTTLNDTNRINAGANNQLILDGANDYGVLIYDKLDVNGNINVSEGKKVATPELCLNGSCKTSWPATVSGSTVMYLRKYNPYGQLNYYSYSPPSCPSATGWTEVSDSFVYYGYQYPSEERVCVTDAICEVMYLRKYNPYGQLNYYSYSPPSCPTGWTEASDSFVYYSQYQSEERVCYKCDTSQPVDGGWSDISWGGCNEDCTKTGTRTCTNPVPQNGGADCVGDSTIIGYCSNETYYRDADNDGYIGSGTVQSCTGAPSGYRDYTYQTDCNDSNPSQYVTRSGYIDSDCDSYGTGSYQTNVCTDNSTCYRSTAGDCNDADSHVRPGAGFSSAAGSDGSWDLNCDGTVTKRFNTFMYATWGNWAGLYQGSPSNCVYRSRDDLGSSRVWGHNAYSQNTSGVACGSGLGWFAYAYSGLYVDSGCTDLAYYAQTYSQECN